MKKIFILLICVLLLFSGCSVRIDKTTAFKKYTDNDKIAAIDKLCSDFYGANGICGLSVGILDGFEVRFFNYGKTSANGQAVTEDTVFQLGTLTEMFTGVMWSEWENRGWFKPDTETAIYFPYTKIPSYNGKNFNSFDLATHSSGLPELPDNFTDYNSYDDFMLRKYFASASLLFEPGTSYSHSMTGMGLLGYLLETRLKTTYEAAVKNSIMYRCSMTSTTVTMTDDQIENAAVPHGKDGKELPFVFPASCLQGAVGFNSCAYDMLIFASLNLAKVDVSTFLERAITLSHQEHGDGIGYGFYITPVSGGNRYHQSSCINGSAGYFGVETGNETAVCVLCNTEIDVIDLAESIFDILNS